jgi:hypothetical protein
MRATLASRCIAFLELLLLSAASSAAVIVTPPNPLSTQTVHIQVVNQYGSAASITSATIIRNGNQFVITETVDLSCSLPLAPILTSDFDVGVLPAGAYQVVAEILHPSVFPGCGGFTLSQSGAFTVADPPAIPMGNAFTYIGLICLLTAFGIWRLKTPNTHEA